MSHMIRFQPTTIPELKSLVEDFANDLDKEQIRKMEDYENWLLLWEWAIFTPWFPFASSSRHCSEQEIISRFQNVSNDDLPKFRKFLIIIWMFFEVKLLFKNTW